jgi:hypothetical protein
MLVFISLMHVFIRFSYSLLIPTHSPPNLKTDMSILDLKPIDNTVKHIERTTFLSPRGSPKPSSSISFGPVDKTAPNPKSSGSPQAKKREEESSSRARKPKLTKWIPAPNLGPVWGQTVFWPVWRQTLVHAWLSPMPISATPRSTYDTARSRPLSLVPRRALHRFMPPVIVGTVGMPNWFTRSCRHGN